MGLYVWTDMPDATASKIVWDDTDKYVVDSYIKPAYRSAIEDASHGNALNASGSLSYLQNQTKLLKSPQNYQSLGFVITDINGRISYLQKNTAAAQQLQAQNATSTSAFVSNIAQQNADAKAVAEKQRCYALAISKFGAAGNLPGMDTLACAIESPVVKWGLIGGVGLIAFLLARPIFVAVANVTSVVKRNPLERAEKNKVREALEKARQESKKSSKDSRLFDYNQGKMDGLHECLRIGK